MADTGKITALPLKKYPEPKLALHYRNPRELLIAFILSARCTDARVSEVTASEFNHACVKAKVASVQGGMYIAQKNNQ